MSDAPKTFRRILIICLWIGCSVLSYTRFKHFIRIDFPTLEWTNLDRATVTLFSLGGPFSLVALQFTPAADVPWEKIGKAISDVSHLDRRASW